MQLPSLLSYPPINHSFLHFHYRKQLFTPLNSFPLKSFEVPPKSFSTVIEYATDEESYFFI